MKISATKSKVLKRPGICTNAYDAFHLSYGQIDSFYNFVLGMVGRIEQTAKIAHEALSHDVSETEKARLNDQWEKRVSPIETLKKQRQFFLEVILVRHIENYLNFLSSLLNEIFVQRPETLKSSEKVDVASVLEHDSIAGLVRAMAERKVESLSYSSFSDLSSFFWDKFHLKLFAESELPTITDAIETRNISVHNRCIINRRYIYRTGGDALRIGKRRELSINEIKKVTEILVRSACTTDTDARRVLQLKGHRHHKANEKRQITVQENE